MLLTNITLNHECAGTRRLALYLYGHRSSAAVCISGGNDGWNGFHIGRGATYLRVRGPGRDQSTHSKQHGRRRI